MRCLALADALRDLGANCTFISREHRGNLVDQIAKSGHKVLPLRQDDEDIEVQVYPRHGMMKILRYRSTRVMRLGWAWTGAPMHNKR